MFTIRFLALFVLFLLPLNAHTEPIATPVSDYVIVWDVGEVLVHINKGSMIWNDLGIKHILKCAWHLMTPQKTRALMYDVLLQYQGPQALETPGNAPVDDEHGNPIPLFMADTWLCSRIPNTQILEHINNAIEKWHPDYSITQGKRDLIKKTLITALSANVLGKNTQCIEAALSLVKAFDQQGVPQYILSNFEDDAFNVMINNPLNVELFSYIPRENITTSGACHMAKPHHDIFKHFVETHNLHNKRIIFIDDQPRNVEEARKCGWTAILLKNRNYTQLAQDLQAAIDSTCIAACA